MFLDEFAETPDEKKPNFRIHGIGYNQMLYDFGLDHTFLNNKTLVQEKINEIEKDFDLVMIAEYFYESLIILKHELCWSLEDVTSFQLNSRIKSDENKMKKRTRKLLTQYLKHDYLLYHHFKKMFIRKLSVFGYTKLEKEVEQLNELDNNIYINCSLEAQPNGFLKGDQKWYGPGFLLGYKVNSQEEDCISMTMSGLKLIERVRSKQTVAAQKVLQQRL